MADGCSDGHRGARADHGRSWDTDYFNISSDGDGDVSFPHPGLSDGFSAVMESRMSKKGFTLVELMVAIAITGIVTAAGFTFFNNTFNFSVLHKRTIDMQREARIGIDILSRDIRLAGFGMIDPMV